MRQERICEYTPFVLRDHRDKQLNCIDRPSKKIEDAMQGKINNRCVKRADRLFYAISLLLFGDIQRCAGRLIESKALMSFISFTRVGLQRCYGILYYDDIRTDLL